MKNYETLKFKWTVSRGQDTYGYNICSLYVNGVKGFSCNGGGYDMKGTVFANYLQEVYQDRLQALNSNDFYGMWFYKNNGTAVERVDTYKESNKKGAYLDGGCGMDAMRKISKAIGLEMEYSNSLSDKNTTVYFIDDARK